SSQRIHKRHVRDGSGKQVWPQVDNRTHQQSSGAPTHDRHAGGRRVFLDNQMFRARNKIRERVPLREEASVFVPQLSEVAAAANMSDREDYAAFDQTQAIGSKIRIDADAVSSITI